MLYVVKFREPGQFEISDTWWPEGAEPECEDADAWTRCAVLLLVALEGTQIEGAYVNHVRVEDVDSGDVMLSVDPRELIFEGPWAERREDINKHFGFVGPLARARAEHDRPTIKTWGAPRSVSTSMAN